MSYFGAISRTVLKTFQCNRHLLITQTQSPKYGSIRLMCILSKMSPDLANKLPERPKRPQSGYNEFYRESAAKLRETNPELKFRDIAKTIANQWKQLDTNTKEELLEKSKKESENYKQEIEKWRKSLNESQKQICILDFRTRKQVMAKRRLKSELKRLEFPIKAKTAFNYWVKYNLENKWTKESDEDHTQHFKRVVTKWATLTDEEKMPYMESAKIDKIRYLQELNDWHQSFKTHEHKETIDKLTKLKAITSRSYLKPDLKKEKTKKLSKKKPKSKKVKAKSLKKSRVKTKGKSKSKKKSKKASKAKSTKPKSSSKTKASKKKSNEKLSETKPKKTKKEDNPSKQETIEE